MAAYSFCFGFPCQEPITILCFLIRPTSPILSQRWPWLIVTSLKVSWREKKPGSSPSLFNFSKSIATRTKLITDNHQLFQFLSYPEWRSKLRSLTLLWKVLSPTQTDSFPAHSSHSATIMSHWYRVWHRVSIAGDRNWWVVGKVSTEFWSLRIELTNYNALDFSFWVLEFTLH